MSITRHLRRKPVIAFSTWRRSVQIAPYGRFDLESVGAEYIERIRIAGGNPVLIPHGDSNDAGDILELVDGLVLIGGEDLEPELYGQPNTGLSMRTDSAADAFEIALAQRARAMRLPTLAICRGLQVVNVALGGSLHQDIAGVGSVAHQAPAADGDTLPSASHLVRAEPGCIVAGLYGVEFDVNSIHHQALARLGSGLKVVGRASDGIIEAVEAADDWAMLGVQWHPEKLPNHAGLFDWLIAAASRHPAERSQEQARPTPVVP